MKEQVVSKGAIQVDREWLHNCYTLVSLEHRVTVLELNW